MLGLLTEKSREKLNASSGNRTVGSEHLKLGDGQLNFSALVGDVVQRVGEGALENVENEGRAGNDGMVGNL